MLATEQLNRVQSEKKKLPKLKRSEPEIETDKKVLVFVVVANVIFYVSEIMDTGVT